MDTNGDGLFKSMDWGTNWMPINGINNPCPQGFRIPTESEFEEERLSWVSNNSKGAFNSPLKLTLTGERSRVSGQIGNVGTFVGYRTSTLSGTSTRVMGISLTNSFMGTRERADGNCIRCIMDEINLGDLNGDAEINIFDVISMVNLILDGGYSIVADINIDGGVNILDIVHLVNIILT